MNKYLKEILESNEIDHLDVELSKIPEQLKDDSDVCLYFRKVGLFTLQDAVDKEFQGCLKFVSEDYDGYAWWKLDEEKYRELKKGFKNGES